MLLHEQVVRRTQRPPYRQRCCCDIELIVVQCDIHPTGKNAFVPRAFCLVHGNEHSSPDSRSPEGKSQPCWEHPPRGARVRNRIHTQ
jgi:hypothetical protein